MPNICLFHFGRFLGANRQTVNGGKKFRRCLLALSAQRYEAGICLQAAMCLQAPAGLFKVPFALYGIQ